MGYLNFVCENSKKLKLLLGYAFSYFEMKKQFLEGWTLNCKYQSSKLENSNQYVLDRNIDSIKKLRQKLGPVKGPNIIKNGYIVN